MSPLRSRCMLLVAAGVIVAGCGAGANRRAVGVTNVPLPRGATIMAHVEICDRGANPYCSEQLVVVGRRYADSADLLNTENRHLRQLGWSVSRGETGKQLAAESPGHELRIAYDTAYNDLLAIDSGWIRRSAPISHALSAAIFDRSSAIALMLERGSS